MLVKYIKHPLGPPAVNFLLDQQPKLDISLSDFADAKPE